MQQVRTFQASSMPEALARVKQELGDQAIILGTRSCPPTGVGALVGRGMVEITAAPPDATSGPLPRVKASRVAGEAPALPEDVYPYYRMLVENEVADRLATRLVRKASQNLRGNGPNGGGALRDVISRTIARMIPVVGGVELAPGVQRRVALIGPGGAGKTTAIAKLAAHFSLRLKKRVAILSLDMQKVGCNEQMKSYAEIIGVEMRTAQTVAGVKGIMTELKSCDLILIDTHGVCAGNQGHFARLAANLRAARPDEVHLVLPATMISSVQARMAQRFGPLGVSRVLLTHLDEAVGLGVILNTIELLQWGLSYTTDGETIPNNIEEACPDRMARLIFPMGD